MDEGDMIIRDNGDIGIIIEKNHMMEKYGRKCMIYWFKNKTFNITYEKIISDYITDVYRSEGANNDQRK